MDNKIQENVVINVTQTGAQETAAQLDGVAQAEKKVTSAERANTSAARDNTSANNENASSVGKVGTAATEASKKTSGFSGALSAIKVALGKTADSSGHLTGMLSKLTRSFARVAFYRAVRLALSAIAKGFKEGTQNIYQYSAAMGGLDASHVSTNLDAIASEILYLKNCLGAILAPIINAITGRFITLGDAIGSVCNKIAAFIAAITGQKTYTKAVKTSAKFAESTASGMSSAAESAKELARTLLSFDEINKLDDNPSSSSGGSSGGGSSAPNYSGMFEEAPVSDKLSKIAEIVTKVINSIKTLAAGSLVAIGLILCATGNLALGIAAIIAGLTIAAVSITKSFLEGDIEDALNKIMALVGPSLVAIGLILAFHGQIGIGIAAIVAGLALSAAAISDNLPAKAQKVLTAILAIVGTAMVAIGVILLLTGAGIPLGIACILSGIASFAGVAGVAMKNEEILSSIKSMFGKVKSFVVGAGKIAVGAMFLLTKQWGAGIQLIQSGLGNLSSATGSSTVEDKVKSVFNKIETFVSKHKIVSGALMCLTGNYVYGVSLMAEGLKSKVSSVFDGGSQVQSKVSSVFGNIKNTIINSTTTAKNASNNNFANMATSASTSLDKVATSGKTAYNTLTTSADTARIKTLSSFAGMGTGASAQLATIGMKSGSAANSMASYFHSAASSAVSSMSSFQSGAASKLSSVLYTAQKVKNGIASTFSNLRWNTKLPHFSWTTTAISKSDWKYKILSTLGLPTSLPKLNVSWYANGGLPNMGELFVARERGPEMVGQINGKSAVANNDQIVDAISKGVYQAMTSASGGNNISVSVDGKTLFDIMVERNNRAVYQTGASPLLV